MPDAPIAFFSYSREDSEFALRLANDLKGAGSAVWIDQIDIGPGERWDRVVQQALESCPSVLIILSPSSVNSNNVMDEVSFALDQQKAIIPVLYRDCDIPFRLRRFQHLDFRSNYEHMLQELRKCLHGSGAAEPAADAAEAPAGPVAPVEPVAAPHPPVDVPPTRTLPSERGGGGPSSFPVWAKVSIPLAAVLIAGILYLSLGTHPTRRDNPVQSQDGSTATPLGNSGGDIGSGLGNIELATALANAQTSPPCSLPASSDSKFLATDPAVWFFFTFRRANPEDRWSVDWVEPNGAVHKTNTVARSAPAGRYCFEMKISGGPAQRTPGIWSVRLNRNGSVVAEKKFAISR